MGLNKKLRTILVAVFWVTIFFTHSSLAIQRPCKSLIAHLNQHMSLRSLDRDAQGELFPLTSEEYQKMSADNVRGLVGKNILVAGNINDPEATNQEVLTLEMLSLEERRLVDTLDQLAHSGKFVRKASRDPVAVYAKDTRALYDKLGIGIDELSIVTEAQRSAPNPIKSGIEVGAWRVLLKSGKTMTAFFTSSLAESIEIKDYTKAISTLLMKIANESPTGLDDILAVQFFHTHPVNPEKGRPNASFLSGYKHDMGITRVYETFFSQISLSIPVHVYAIARVEGQSFVFHGRNPGQNKTDKPLSNYEEGEVERRLKAFRERRSQ